MIWINFLNLLHTILPSLTKRSALMQKKHGKCMQNFYKEN